MAVDYSQNENVLASCSNDGSATVWRIGSNGKTGSGSICELDPGFFVDPEVDCVEFGRNASRDKLFLGVNNKDFDHPGYVSYLNSILPYIYISLIKSSYRLRFMILKQAQHVIDSVQ